MRKRREIHWAEFDEATQSFVNYRTARGFPLGGIGNGGFSFFTDGGLGEFRTQHNWFRAVKNPKGTFFAIWMKSQDKTITRILRRDYRGGKEFGNVANIKKTRFVGKIPQFELEYADQDLPLSLILKGFSPLIPNNPKDSSLPVAVFQFEITNPTREVLEVALLFSFENILGLGGSGGSFLLLGNGPVKYRSTRGNFAEPTSSSWTEGIRFKTRQEYAVTDPHRRVVGEYALDYVFAEDHTLANLQVSKCLQWDPQQEACQFWESFSQDGTLKHAYGTKPKRNAGAIAVKFTMDPGVSHRIEFLLSWWMPYYVIEKSPVYRKLFGTHAGTNHGHYFLNFFDNFTGLTEYVVKERARLYAESCELPHILETSSLPPWLTTLVLNMTDSILVNSVFTKDGHYYMMEGVPWGWLFGALTGTNDQRLSSHPYTATFFPSLDKAELESFRSLTEEGQVPHGNGNADLALNDSSVPYAKPIKLLNKTTDWLDLTMSQICQTGKLILITGDIEYLKLSWNDLKKMAEYLHRNTIEGVPEGGSTYDLVPYHPCFLYNVVLYLAALSMMIHLAQLLMELAPLQRPELEDLVATYKERFDIADRAYNERLWRQEGYYMVCEARNTLFQGGFAGDWIARYAGLPPIVDISRAKSHSEWQSKALVDSHIDMPDGTFPGLPLPYAEATPDGTEVKMKVFYLRMPNNNYFWQVLSYQAMEAIYLGRVEAGLKIMRQLYEKIYFQGYPWDANLFAHPGYVYMTHPVMWALFNALTGAALDLPRRTLYLSPRLLPSTTQMRIPFFFPKFWALLTYEITTQIGQLEILKSFDESLIITRIINRTSDGVEHQIELEKPLKIKKGERLELELKI